MSFLAQGLKRFFATGPINPADSASARTFIQDELSKQKKVTMFIWTSCPYCWRAQSLFKDVYGPERYEENVNIVNIDTRSDVKSALAEMTGQSSVPRIFIDDKCIGGYDNSASLNSNGQLKQLLGI